MPPEKVETRSSRRSSSADQAQHAVDPRVDPRGGHAVEHGVEAQVLLGGELLVEGLLLEDEPDPPSHRLRLGHDVEAVDARRTRGRPGEGAQHLDRRGLAGPVRAEEGEDLPRAHRETTSFTASTSP